MHERMSSASGSDLEEKKFFWWVMLPIELSLSTALPSCLKKFIK